MAKVLKVRNASNTGWDEIASSVPDVPDISTFLTISSASSTYLTQANASATYATKTELDNIDLSSASAAVVTYLVDSAPATLDTLNELAQALNDDSNFATTITNSLSNKQPLNNYLTDISSLSGSTGILAISDPYIWQSSSLPASLIWQDVIYGSDKFVAVSGLTLSGSAAYSTDGITWTATSMPSSARWSSVAYGGGKFVAISGRGGADNKSAYSNDGINWMLSTLPSSREWIDVVYGNGIFIAIASNTTSAAYSTDGITWTATSMPWGGAWSSVAYGNGKFIAVTGGQDGAYSTDGITWNYTVFEGTGWNKITYGNNKFLAISLYFSNVLISSDGQNWTVNSSVLPEVDNQNTYPFWNSVTYYDGKFMAVSSEQTVTFAYSIDGNQWYSMSAPERGNWGAIAGGNNKFVVIPNSSYQSSYSGYTLSSNQSSIFVKSDRFIPYSQTEPLGPKTGDLWVDSSTNPPALKTYNGSSWVQLGSAVDDAQAIIAGSMFMG